MLTGLWHNPENVGEGLSIYDTPHGLVIISHLIINGHCYWYYSQKPVAVAPGHTVEFPMAQREEIDGELLSRGSLWIKFNSGTDIEASVLVSYPGIAHRPMAPFVKIL